MQVDNWPQPDQIRSHARTSMHFPPHPKVSFFFDFFHPLLQPITNTIFTYIRLGLTNMFTVLHNWCETVRSSPYTWFSHDGMQVQHDFFLFFFFLIFSNNRQQQFNLLFPSATPTDGKREREGAREGAQRVSLQRERFLFRSGPVYDLEASRQKVCRAERLLGYCFRLIRER